MESKYVHEDNGQEVTQDDLNLVAGEAALADDRVLAELLRIKPFDGTTVVKRVMPFRYSDTGMVGTQDSIVVPDTGGVAILPFRAIVGSRTAVAANATDNWRDIRSALHVGSGQLHTHIDLASDTGGGARFDLIYAVVTVDQASSVSRKVKDPATLVVTTQSVNSRVNTTVTVTALKGTEGSAAKPALPADAGNVYYIGLAYVRVAAGFVSGATAVQGFDVWEWADCANIAESTGAMSVRVADGNNDPAGAVETNTAWTTAGVRPPAHLPSTMVGGESLLIALDLTTGSASHATGDVIDASRDWRNRLFRFWIYAKSATGVPKFPWQSGAASPMVPEALAGAVIGDTFTTGMGQSFKSARLAAYADAAAMSELAAGVAVLVNALGELELYLPTGAPNAKVLIWLDASAQFANAP